MAVLCSLPTELKYGIMSELASAKDLLNLALTCKAMNTSVQDAGGIIIYQILSRQLSSSEIAVTTAHYAAVTAPWKYKKDPSIPISTDQTTYLKHVTEFCGRYLTNQATKLSVPTSSFTLPMALYIEGFHATVQELSEERATVGVQSSNIAITDPIPTKIEIEKIVKAFYIIDIVIHIFPRSPVTIREHHKPNPSKEDKAFNRFWTCFSPWESEQVQYLYQHLIERLTESAKAAGIEETQRYMCDIACSVIIWKGIKGIAHMIDKTSLSDEDKEMFKVMQEPEYKKLRQRLHQDQYRWFKTADELDSNAKDEDDEDDAAWDSPFFNVWVKLNVLRQYNVDQSFGSAQVWLWTLGDHSGHDLGHIDDIFRDGAEFCDRVPGGYFWQSWLFWDMDRLRLVSEGLFPSSLEQMRRIETTTVNLDAREYDDNIEDED
ncbi:hypothetical protein HD806DRAFT_539786 [Xylariaceae sp. AK1471]|nr:hypothetical protein HD806DRAFT_539786 [Xylariaceae sp. AK1471]